MFRPAGRKAAPDVRTNVECTEAVFRAGLEPLSLAGVKTYFDQLYWRRGAEAMDRPILEGAPWPILPAIRERRGGTFEFETIARAFRMIDDGQETVIVPYDGAAEALLAKVAQAERPTGTDRLEILKEGLRRQSATPQRLVLKDQRDGSDRIVWNFAVGHAARSGRGATGGARAVDGYVVAVAFEVEGLGH
jgi:hypothetical protein